jgi:potassium-transporting ATPase KdpC subunit
MKELLPDIRRALVATVVLALLCCGLYPLAVWGIAQVVFPHQANGSLILAQDGTVRGSEFIGQNFTELKYFHPRPSFAGKGYDAANSGGSNLGPTSKKLSEFIRARIAIYRTENELSESDPIPADAVTASGSGLDPHISLRNAELQAPRVARVRGWAMGRVHSLIEQNTDRAGFGFLGEPGVNVLRLNLALDSLW